MSERAGGRPLVSVIVPARDEAADLAGCLDRVAQQSYGAEDIEVLVVDGASTDATAAVAAEALADAGFARWAVLSNPARGISAGLGVGLAAARGDIVVRVDARCRLGSGHVARAVEVLAARPDVGVVGGAQRAQPRDERVLSTGIARALNNRWTTGLARYRRSNRPGPADTVWLGSFRTAELRALGGWDPTVELSEDFDLNERYRRSGALVWFDPAMTAGYLPRPDLVSLARQYFRFGRGKATMWTRGRRPRPRQVALVVAPPVAALAMAWVGRRYGWLPLGVVLALGALAVDALGADRGQPASVPARLSALAATTTSCTAWWVGVVCGACRG